MYFHHRAIFDEFEAETHLTARFSHFALRYDLMSASALLVPPEASARGAGSAEPRGEAREAAV